MSHSSQSNVPLNTERCPHPTRRMFTNRNTTHYKTMTHPLQNSVQSIGRSLYKKQNHCNTVSHPLQNNIPPTRGLLNTEIKFIARQCPNPLSDSVSVCLSVSLWLLVPCFSVVRCGWPVFGPPSLSASFPLCLYHFESQTDILQNLSANLCLQ